MVNPSFWSKNGYFSKTFFLGNIAQENVFYDILKSLKIFSFPIELTHGFGPKKSIFSIFFYPIYIGQENVFYDILQRKNSFLGYKEKKFKKSNNWDFSKIVNPWFSYKNGHFSKLFFLANIGQENIFYDILQRKNSFLGYEKRFKKSKNLHFSKGVNQWFWAKNGYFSKHFFFIQYRPGKCLLRYVTMKKSFLRYKSNKF